MFFKRKIIDKTPYSRAMIFYFFIQILIAIALYTQGVGEYFFWYCYHVPLLYTIAFWAKNPQMIFGLMHVGIVVQLTWIADLLAHLGGKNISNQATFLFQDGPMTIKVISIITHIAVPLTALFWTYKIKPNMTSLYYSLAYIPLLYLLTLWLAPAGLNINCILQPCAQIMPTWYYTQIWPFYLFGLCLATYGMHTGFMSVNDKK